MQPAPADPSTVRRVVLASFIGTTVEWYDFFLYGTASALVFNKLFFPTFDPHAGTMAAFATYAVGFFARPIGGIVFGHFGDKIGRKSVLVTTLMLMGVATFCIGLLPTYGQAGILAPILLVALRFVQGFGVGGEWGGAVLMAVEHGHAGRRGLFASCVQAGMPIGLLLANGAFKICSGMDEAKFLAWGWRVPFLLGILLLGVGMFIRLRVMESPVFMALQNEAPPPKTPVLEVLRRHPRNVLLAMGARFAENAFFYIFTVFVLSYGATQLGLPNSTMLNGVLIGSAVQFFVIPLFGALSDRLGRRLTSAARCFSRCSPFPSSGWWTAETPASSRWRSRSVSSATPRCMDRRRRSSRSCSARGCVIPVRRSVTSSHHRWRADWRR